MRRVFVPVLAIGLVLTAVLAVRPAAAAPRGAECNLSGTAKISPGLSTKAATQRVTLSGVKLTGCHMGSTSSAGVPKTITGTVTIPSTTAKASCASGNLALKPTIKWSTGKSTVASVTTRGITANQYISGKVTSSTDPSVKAGDLVQGNADFRPVPASQNCASKPVTAVTFNGVLALGSPR
jgi:hypothetical protein